MANIPQTQDAVQLVGPDELVLNSSKEVFRPGRHQILCRVEAVGLCFSDLKLLKQFSSHVRKSEIVSGIGSEVLKEIPSYVPGEAATVPGHETVVRIEAIGPGVENFRLGGRFLVQTDYRWLRTASSNGAFGYNFEGALQEYVLMDERIITSPDGDSMLLPVGDELSGSAIALVEPWACVENAYVSKERTSLKLNGQMLVVVDREAAEVVFQNLFNHYGRPAQITWVSKSPPPVESDVAIKRCTNVSELTDAGYDDVVYFGSMPEVVEALFAKVATNGLLNIVLCGGRFGRDVVTTVGRVHYGGIRIVGTTGSEPAESMEVIPDTDEIRLGDKINIIGAGGPMGMMHVIRNICQGVEGVSVFASDVDENRLAALTRIAAPLARKNGVEYKAYNPIKEAAPAAFDYTALMAPIPDLVAASVRSAPERGLINIFAGIPATVTAGIDLDAYIEKRLYFIGTSGSTLDDMKRMLAKAESGKLDTNVSVAAVCGLAGATEGIRAVENRSIAGKIIVYPACKGLGLVLLEELNEKMPEVAKCLNHGLWTKAAEQKLLESFES
ncbi:MAG: alcohol dehydrogenase catalytic domain-containing protein [Planctomycetota bacterium]|jgi:threonine dehydrogenase-like Zn-dependent dehydrogenase